MEWPADDAPAMYRHCWYSAKQAKSAAESRFQMPLSSARDGLLIMPIRQNPFYGEVVSSAKGGRMTSPQPVSTVECTTTTQGFLLFGSWPDYEYRGLIRNKAYSAIDK
jgi:hypothetical protein